jgi:hypothetical protein
LKDEQPAAARALAYVTPDMAQKQRTGATDTSLSGGAPLASLTSH